jgi:hypothetical protein
MKLAGVLAGVLLLAVPAAAAAQGHAGGGAVAVGSHGGPGAGLAPGAGHLGGFHGPGPGSDRGFRFRDRFLVWGWPYWGWSDCGLYGDNCDWDGPGEPGPPADGYADASMTGPPPCGAWVSRAGGYAWAPDACRESPAAADPPHAALAAGECSDWVWRASLHRSVCRHPSRASG